MTEARIAELIDRAFDYRGYVTLRRSDGSQLVGFVYHRSASHVELFDETATRRLTLPIDQIVDVAFTGEDTAAKSQQMWEKRKGKLEPRDTPADGGWGQSGVVLLLAALDRELRVAADALRLSMRGSVARGGRVVARAVGIGGDPAGAIDGEKPGLIVSFGFAGALDAKLAAGDLVLATSVRGASGDAFTSGEAALLTAGRALEGLALSRGEIVTSTSVAATPAEKRAIARAGAVAVDMESYAVARAAHDAGIPWLALRAIVDPLDVALPAFAREERRGYLAPALRYALSGGVRDLLRLARDARRAAASLDAALKRLVPALSGAEVHA